MEIVQRNNLYFCLLTAEARLPHDIVAPRSIQDLPEKLLTSGIYLPGMCYTFDIFDIYLRHKVRI